MSRPLDPVSLKHFVAVCEEGNIARAAARESLVASALSKRVSALEAEVGVPLLTRRRRGVEPTAAGQALLVRAREVLAGRPSLRFVDTLDQPSINVSPGGQMDQLLRRQAALAGRLPAYRMQVSSLDTACRLVAAGLGLAILPLEAATPHAGAGRLAFVPLAETWAVRRFVVVARAEPVEASAARRMAGHLVAAAAGASAPGAEPA